MSLRSTIEEAKREAAAARDASATPARTVSEAEDEQRSGFTKKSTARAKPARDAGASVRVAPASKGRSSKGAAPAEDTMTKEERKAARRARRADEDRRATASRMLLKADEAYKKGQRTWWLLLGVGLALTIASIVVTYLNPDVSLGFDDPLGILAVVFTGLAYVFIIAAFIFDWRNVRPLRLKYDKLTHGMGEKRLDQILAGDADEIGRELAAKKAKKGRKARRG